MPRVTLNGSERLVMPGAHAIGPADPHEALEVSVVLRRKARELLQSRVSSIASGDRSVGVLTREEFARMHGTDDADFAAIRRFAAINGLTVLLEHAARATVRLRGTVAQFSQGFSVELRRMQHAGGMYRGRIGPIELPSELSGVVEAVLGLDDRPQAKPHFRLRRPTGAGAASSAAGAPVSYSPTQVASLYGFPPGSGAGETVALIELGGGFEPADLATYFSRLAVGSPSVSAVSVDHAKNSPTGSADGPDGEVMLDIEVVGAIVPAAAIVAYFAPNTDAGFLDAITTAVHDTTYRPHVISISWGGPESTWTAQALGAMDAAFQAAAALGITVCVASGDNGSSDGVSTGGNHVDFPASSPHVLGCGGTRLLANTDRISSEVVWNDGASGGAGGGGVSTVFALPGWQAQAFATDSGGTAAPLTKRGVPDVSGDADPQSGYDVRIDGTDTVIGGTSAVAPLWAALIARVNQATGKPAGFINPQLYANPTALRDVTEGNNGSFAASPGWDACTGLGTPDGPRLAALL